MVSEPPPAGLVHRVFSSSPFFNPGRHGKPLVDICLLHLSEYITSPGNTRRRRRRKKGSNKIKFFLSLGITGLGHLKSPCWTVSVLTRGSASSGGFCLSSWTACSPRLLSLSHPSISSWPLRTGPPCNTVCRASSRRRSGRGWGSAIKKTIRSVREPRMESIYTQLLRHMHQLLFIH